MEAVREILEAYGHESVAEIEPGTHYKIEVPGFEELVIEKLDSERLSVAHYYTQRGDLMSDPEVVFHVDRDDWTPVRYTQHSITPQRHEYDPSGLNLGGFLRTWNRNLYDQGFVEAANGGDAK